jgi:hypothetical protein
MDVDDLMEFFNQIDPDLDVIKTLRELGPLMDDAGGRYFRHSITLLAMIHELVTQVERHGANLLAQVRAEVSP